MRLPKNILVALLLLISHAAISQEHDHRVSSNNEEKSWTQLLNKKAPDFDLEDWVNSQPLNLEKLKGKVVLIRWWLETCPYCKATAPSLNEFHKSFSDDGLVIIGMYHSKPIYREISKREVQEFGDAKSFEFPLAIDKNWEVLRSYWPREIPMSYTSVSFLIDREGIIRYIHPGGSYSILGQPYDDSKWAKDYHEIKAQIESLLK